MARDVQRRGPGVRRFDARTRSAPDGRSSRSGLSATGKGYISYRLWLHFLSDKYPDDNPCVYPEGYMHGYMYPDVS